MILLSSERFLRDLFPPTHSDNYCLLPTLSNLPDSNHPGYVSCLRICSTCNYMLKGIYKQQILLKGIVKITIFHLSFRKASENLISPVQTHE